MIGRNCMKSSEQIFEVDIILGISYFLDRYKTKKKNYLIITCFRPDFLVIEILLYLPSYCHIPVHSPNKSELLILFLTSGPFFPLFYMSHLN